ncbi:MAG: RNA-binding protein [Thermoprotei archaeon]|nr:MAG: RNA-binding protein [Thermoprotei archaeon]
MKAKRHLLSKKDKKALIKEIAEKYPELSELIKEAEIVEKAETDEGTVIIADKTPCLIILEEDITIPALKILLKEKYQDLLPKVVVDMGAVPHIANGADVMAPGITQIKGDFEKGDIVVVVDERHGKPLAVCRAWYSSSEIRQMKKGKVLENLHYVGDDLWEFFKSLA